MDAITAAQARAARAMLRLSLGEVAKRAGVSVRTLSNLEGERITKPLPMTLAAVKRAFEALGVEFTNGRQPGVRLKAKP